MTDSYLTKLKQLLALTIVLAHIGANLLALWYHVHPDHDAHHGEDAYHTHFNSPPSAPESDDHDNEQSHNEALHLWEGVLNNKSHATIDIIVNNNIGSKSENPPTSHLEIAPDQNCKSSFMSPARFRPSAKTPRDTYVHFWTNLSPPLA